MTDTIIDPSSNFIQTVMVNFIFKTVNSVDVTLLLTDSDCSFLDISIELFYLLQSGIVKFLQEMALMLAVNLTFITFH